MDMSFMSKFLVQGPSAGDCLNWVSTANVDGQVGEITYCQWLNEGGTLVRTIQQTLPLDSLSLFSTSLSIFLYL
eukprot:COSAG05_NODE_812_length_7171_cov_13.392534_7_plen_74_part_00